MGALKVALAFALVAAPLPAAAQDAADPVARWRPLISEAAARFALPPAWIERVMRAESAGQTMRNGRLIRSRVGAIGLMQLMPATWAEMRRAYHLGQNPDDPRDNIIAGTAYLRLMYDRFGYPGLFAAYNAGPGRYAAYLAGRAGLPAETRAYMASVAGPGEAKVTATSPLPGEVAELHRQRLFVLRDDQRGERPQQAESALPDRLFLIRRDLP